MTKLFWRTATVLEVIILTALFLIIADALLGFDDSILQSIHDVVFN